jgi:macrodomain Ter protein organizer (MatP/YcbG family)
MQSMLTEKLWAYIVHNNPDLMFSLQEDFSVTRYLEEKVNAVMPLVEQLLGEGKPPYTIEELCLNAMTEELKPSRYQYLRSVIEEEFNGDYERMKENGTLTYEVVNLIETCKGIFSDFDFNSENEANRHLRYAIIGKVHDYLA